jgi:glucose-1-phosphatase
MEIFPVDSHNFSLSGKGIKNILFDLGGVLLTIHPEASGKAFSKLLDKPVHDFFAEVYHLDLFKRFESGFLTDEEFFDQIRQLTGKNISNETITEAWNAMIGHIPVSRLELLKKLSEQYKLYLFSNTNNIHYQKYNGDLKKECGANIDDFFTKCYCSHLIKYRKPNKEAFEFVLNDAGILAEETLFIDDFLDNIEGAKIVGIKTLHLTNDLETVFENMFF